MLPSMRLDQESSDLAFQYRTCSCTCDENTDNACKYAEGLTDF